MSLGHSLLARIEDFPQPIGDRTQPGIIRQDPVIAMALGDSPWEWATVSGLPAMTLFSAVIVAI